MNALTALQLKLKRRNKEVPRRTLDECRQAGYDAAVNGADKTNCHFSYFESAEKTAAWEEGNDEGLKKARITNDRAN